MSEEELKSTLRGQYVTQVAADLERNEAERQRVLREVDALQGQLDDLQKDHAALLGMQAALQDGHSVSASASASRDSVFLPATRGSQSGAISAKAPKARKGRNGQPSLRVLVTNYLAHEGEPRSASEVASALALKYPARNVNVTVVRNAAEASVARGEVARTRQQKSVFYFSVKSADTAGQTDSSDTPQGETFSREDEEA